MRNYFRNNISKNTPLPTFINAFGIPLEIDFNLEPKPPKSTITGYISTIFFKPSNTLSIYLISLIFN